MVSETHFLCVLSVSRNVEITPFRLFYFNAIILKIVNSINAISTHIK